MLGICVIRAGAHRDRRAAAGVDGEYLNEPFPAIPCGHGRAPMVAVTLGGAALGAIAGAGSLPRRPRPSAAPAPRPAALRRSPVPPPAETKSPADHARRRPRHPRRPPPAASVQTADPFGEQFTLESKKVVVMKGTANWDAAFDTLIDSFKALTALLDKQGIKAAGNVDDRLHLDRRYRLHLPRPDPGRAGRRRT